MLAQPVVVGLFEKHPHFSGSELFGWPETVEPVAEALLQRWSHSEGSGARSLTGGFRAWSFGPNLLTKATISLAVKDHRIVVAVARGAD